MVRARHALAAVFATALAWGVGVATAEADVPGVIAGHVSATSGPVCVYAQDASGQTVAQTATDANGDYAMADVPAGTWTVEFIPDLGCNGQVTNEAFQYYAGRSTPATADPVTVTAGQTTSLADVTLAPAAQIVGTVTDTAGRSLFGVCVVLEDTAGRAVLRQLTDQQGNYTLRQLPAGDFLVHFVADGCTGARQAYTPQYYGGGTDPSGARVITLIAGATRSFVDGTLAPAAQPPAPPPGTTVVSGPPGSPPALVPATGAGGSTLGASGSTPGGTAAGTARLGFLAAPRGGFRLDGRHRLALRLRCERGGKPCKGSIHLSLPARRGRPGRLIGRRGFSVPADGRAHLLRVTVRGPRPHAVALTILLQGRSSPAVRTTLNLR